MRRPVFQKDEKIFETTEAPFFRAPDRYYASVSVLAVILLGLYIPIAGRLGFKVLLLPLLTCIVGAITEIAGSLITKKAINYFGIASWLIFPFLIPPGLPIWMSLTAFVLSLIICQILFGGFGKHIFHPAVFGQIFLLMNFTKQYNFSFLKPFDDAGFGFSAFTSMSFTDKSVFKQLAMGMDLPLDSILLGPNIGLGSEIFPFLIVIAGLLYLLFGNVNYRTPFAFIIVFVASTIIGRLIFPDKIMPVLPALLGGGTLFYAFFIFSDTWTGSKTGIGRLLAGAVAAVLVIVIRSFSSNVEGVMFAAAFTYSFSPLYDQFALSIDRRAKRKS